jgi:hypothetical protein
MRGSDSFEHGANDDDTIDGGAWAMDTRPSLLIVAPHADQADVAAMASGAGFRVAATVAPDMMANRLAHTVGVDALLVDLRGFGADDGQLIALLTSLLAWPAWCDTKPLILADLDATETIAATLHLRLDRLLCEAALSDIGLALCLLAREGTIAARLHDIGRESDAARLEELSAEVRRLARTIDRLARDDLDNAQPRLHDRNRDYTPPPSNDTLTERPRKGADRMADGATRSEVRVLLQARRMRDRFLPSDLFADPAWDMMLDLMGARIDGKTVSVSSLCIAAAVPPTTALRWIAQLTERGIFERRNDPDDARRVFISLSDAAANQLTGWFSAVRHSGLRFAR